VVAKSGPRDPLRVGVSCRDRTRRRRLASSQLYQAARHQLVPSRYDSLHLDGVIERVAAGRYELVIERSVERVLPATRRHMPSSICSADEPSFSRLLAQSSLTCYTRAHNLRSACGLQWPLSASAFCRDSCFTRPHIVWRCVYSKATRKAMRNSSNPRRP
jgi:hypothetical protein